MARKFLTPIDLAKNEIQNGVAQNLASAPGSPVKGQFYMNTTDNTWYWWDGTVWVAAKSAAASYGNPVTEQTFGGAPANGVAVTGARSDHQHGNPSHAFSDHSTYRLDQWAVPTADVSLNSRKITSLATPTAGTDATTKDYVDNLAAGLSWKDSVRVATTANIAIATALNSGDAIDGVTLANGDRVLVKNQTAPAENGIYVVAASPARATDADLNTELEGATVFVAEGTQADTAWTMTTNAPITVGTTGLTWVQFGAGTAYTAGAGLTLTGSTFDVVAADASIVVAADSIRVGYFASGGDYGTMIEPARANHAHSGTYPGKYSTTVGGSTTAVVTHNLNTREVIVGVARNGTPFETVDCDVERTDMNNVTLRFSVAPAASEYRVTVIG